LTRSASPVYSSQLLSPSTSSVGGASSRTFSSTSSPSSVVGRRPLRPASATQTVRPKTRISSAPIRMSSLPLQSTSTSASNGHLSHVSMSPTTAASLRPTSGFRLALG